MTNGMLQTMRLITQIATNSRKIMQLRSAATSSHLYRYFLYRLREQSEFANSLQNVKYKHPITQLRGRRIHVLQQEIRHSRSSDYSLIQPSILVHLLNGQTFLNPNVRTILPARAIIPGVISKHAEPINISRTDRGSPPVQWLTSRKKASIITQTKTLPYLQNATPIARVNTQTGERANDKVANTNKSRKRMYANIIDSKNKHLRLLGPRSASTIVHSISNSNLKIAPFASLIQREDSNTTKIDSNQWAYTDRSQHITNKNMAVTKATTQLYRKGTTNNISVAKQTNSETYPSYVTMTNNVQTTVEDILYDIISKVKSMK